jgi:hypothetical protein
MAAAFSSGDAVFFGVTDASGKSVSVLPSTYFDGVVASLSAASAFSGGIAALPFLLIPGSECHRPEKAPFLHAQSGTGAERR